MNEGSFFRMEKINKIYQMGQQQAHVLFDVDLSIEEGEYLSVLGYYSGSLHGNTTRPPGPPSASLTRTTASPAWTIYPWAPPAP